MLLGRLFCLTMPAMGACPPVAVCRQVPKRVPAILYCAREGGIPMRGFGRGHHRAGDETRRAVSPTTLRGGFLTYVPVTRRAPSD